MYTLCKWNDSTFAHYSSCTRKLQVFRHGDRVEPLASRNPLPSSVQSDAPYNMVMPVLNTSSLSLHSQEILAAAGLAVQFLLHT